ncbi:MAG: phosphatase PAP2 family protein [Muribaculum sp.]|nr:phosphatase PAP2 family protein [Muribaculum sp.]
MIEYLNQLDASILLFFNGMHSPFFDKFMMLCTGRFIWIPMYVTILLILIKSFKPKQVLLYAIALAIAITLTDQTCSSIIRPIFERLRPSNPENPLSQYIHIVNGYRGGSYGFPSCHAANSFALAVFVVCLVRRRRLAFFIFGWAILNSYSRIYLGVHYPGDLFIGAIVGSFFGYICYRAARRFNTETDGTVSHTYRIPVFKLNLEPLQQTIGITVGDIMIFTGTITLFIIIASSLINIS